MDAENGDAYLERSPPPNNEAEGHPDRPENDDHRNEDEIMDAENGDAYLERSPPPNNEAEGPTPTDLKMTITAMKMNHGAEVPRPTENDMTRNEDEIMEWKMTMLTGNDHPPPSNNDSELQRQLQHEAQHINQPLDDMKRIDLADKSNSDDNWSSQMMNGTL
ncbi:hypothetical protein TYRP_009861 [Tyrophagus putrescentiae]|nr:hypothetical protein TYRP_009861 [Tyrophagus putrescentiae]